jgi:hypothetical protein
MAEWMLTYTGRKFNPFHHPEKLDPQLILVDDLAHSLSNVCRFGGHCRKFYSVAQHSILVARRVGELCPADMPAHVKAEAQLMALLHDATEAYLPDLVGPFKSRYQVMVEKADGPVLMDFDLLEKMLRDAIHVRFGLTYNHLAEDFFAHVLDQADKELLVTEARDLMSHLAGEWNIPLKPLNFTITPWDSDESEIGFLKAFEQFNREMMTPVVA